MSRARRRFEERKRKLKIINEIYYDWRSAEWDGKHLVWDWVWRRSKIIKWWREDGLRMSESGHHRTWMHPLMVKPWRARCHHVERNLLLGRVDPDEVLFPVYCRPWIYYW